jgi:hypothetical protein
MIRVNLPYPAKILWPNGRTRNYHAKAAEVKKHRGWADTAALAALPVCHPQVFAGDHKLPVHIAVTGKPGGPFPDQDGVVASAKSYLDGIADRIGVNDRRFMAPTVEFIGRSKTGGFTITIGGPNGQA